MKRHLTYGSILIGTLLVFAATGPSWAHFHGGVGLYIGPGAFWDSGPYDGPYDSYSYPYYDPYPYAPYVYVPYEQEYRSAPPETPSQPDVSRHDLTYIEGRLARAEEEINYDYDDGDITKVQRDRALRNLKEIREEAYSEAKANGGYLTGDDEKDLLNEIRNGPRRPRPSYSKPPPPTSDRNLAAIHDEVSRLRNLLEKKFTEGNITKTQRDGMLTFLDRTEKLAQSQASANGGALSREEEEAVRQQLDRAKQAIQTNLIMK